MPVQNYDDVFNNVLDELAQKLAAVSGLQVVTDPRNLKPPCVFIDAPSFTAFNFNVVRLLFPVRILSLGPSNLDAQRNLNNLAALVLTANIGVTEGRPTVAIIGGTELPAYDLTVAIEAHTYGGQNA
jgi:hypothetical protein